MALGRLFLGKSLRLGFTGGVQKRRRLGLFVAGLVMLGQAALAQGAPEGATLSSVPPDVFINIKQYPTGAEMVTVTVRREGYPADLLKAQCERVGTETGRGIRGLQVSATDMKTAEPVTLARASFATDELIAQSTGALNLQAIARAFVGGPPEWRVNALLVTFEDQFPTAQTLQSLNTEAVKVGSQILEGPSGIEYRILLSTDSPEDVEIPSLVVATQASDGTKASRKRAKPLAVCRSWNRGIVGGGFGILRRAPARLPQVRLRGND